MYSFMISFMPAICLSLIGAGILVLSNPALQRRVYAWRVPIVVSNLALFTVAMIAIGIFGGQEAMAAAAAAGETSSFIAHQATAGMGLELIGVGLPTAVAAVGAGVAVGQIGAASLAVVAEKPEMFGRTLIFLGLGEGIAIYGLVMSILLLGKL